MLPSHSQNTAAVDSIHWAELTSYKKQEAMSLLNSRAKVLPNSLIKYKRFIKIKVFKKPTKKYKNTNFNIIYFININI